MFICLLKYIMDHSCGILNINSTSHQLNSNHLKYRFELLADVYTITT